MNFEMHLNRCQIMNELPLEVVERKGLEYFVTSGVLFIFLAFRSFREFETWTWFIALIAGITSIGTMTFVNFKIESDFKWWILLLSLIWVSAIVLNLFNKTTCLGKTAQKQKETL